MAYLGYQPRFLRVRNVSGQNLVIATDGTQISAIGTTLVFYDYTDQTKALAFEANSNTTGKILTLSAAVSNSLTLTFPNPSGNDTLVSNTSTSTLTNKSLTAPQMISYIGMPYIATPPTPSAGVNLYWNSSDDSPHYINSAGTDFGFGNATPATATSYGVVKGANVPGSNGSSATATGYIGEIISSSGTGTISNNTLTPLAELVVSAGIWLAIGSCNYISVSGYIIEDTALGLNTVNNVMPPFGQGAVVMDLGTGTFHQFSQNISNTFVFNTSSNPIYLLGNAIFSGGTVNYSWSFTCVRIG